MSFQEQELFEDSSSEETSAFSSQTTKNDTPTFGPLAHRARPKTLKDFQGHENIEKKAPWLLEAQTADMPGLILWGPPGSGKTTLAELICSNKSLELYHFNAVLGGVSDLKKLISRCLEMQKRFGHQSAIFIDEIHRFNKAQQDALLPYVEKGEFIFIGATTENPRTSINKALLSRVQILKLEALHNKHIFTLLKNAQEKFLTKKFEDTFLNWLALHSGGDARKALNALEISELFYKKDSSASIENLQNEILQNFRQYDRNQNNHYDVISAFIKSLRGSAPDAALIWLAVMIEGGEDPAFIARRLVIFAAEDVGLSDPNALVLANSALGAVEKIGMPEARIILSEATIYLASTLKSNSAYKAIDSALEYVRLHPEICVPEHLKNHPNPTHPIKYQYPHDFPEHFLLQDYLPKELKNKRFFYPTENGKEKFLKDRLLNLWNKFKN